MVKQILKLSSVILTSALLFASLTAITYADAKSEIIGGAETASGEDAPDDAGATLGDTIINAVEIFSLVIGIVSVIFIMIGGFKYVTSSGDSGKLSSAKNTIIFAVIGLIIASLAQVIVNFVLNESS